jgi:hypothetical protein
VDWWLLVDSNNLSRRRSLGGEDVFHVHPAKGKALVGTQPPQPEKELGKVS